MRESYAGGPLNGLNVTNGCDQCLRRTNLPLLSPSSQLLTSTAHAYDPASRLLTVGDGANRGTYDNLDNSPLVAQIAFATNGTTVRTTTKAYDYLNRLTNIASSSSSFSSAFAYQYNSANQRTSVTNVDGSYWVYSYDSMGQVTAGRKYWGDNTPVAGQQFEYGFDEIGNRKSTLTGGDATGGGLRSATYTANAVNQSTSRTVPGYVDILGIANPTASVTVNSIAASRKGEYYNYALPVVNTSASQYPSVTVASTYAPGQNQTGKVFVPKTPESYTYDTDGNLTQDGRWDYTWDGENRLVKLQSRAAGSPTGSKLKLEFAYDDKGRWIWKKVTSLDTSTVLSENKFVYDGWNLVGILAPNSSLLYSFSWGLDASGSMQGAGGVGGLLWDKEFAAGAAVDAHFAALDGNGNVSALVRASDGAETGRYEYGPFGEPVRQTGTYAGMNPFRFSTKYTENESGLLYYGYRYYNPTTGRWPNRDPIEEEGGINLYGFVKNRPTGVIDYLGLNQICVDYSCKCVDLSRWTYLEEAEAPSDEDKAAGRKEGAKKPRYLPPPGGCVHADALYYPGGAVKIGDLGTVYITCQGGKPTWRGTFTHLFGDGSRWEYGDPNPPKRWPAPNIPPYKIDPPGDPDRPITIGGPDDPYPYYPKDWIVPERDNTRKRKQ